MNDSLLSIHLLSVHGWVVWAKLQKNYRPLLPNSDMHLICMILIYKNVFAFTRVHSMELERAGAKKQYDGGKLPVAPNWCFWRQKPMIVMNRIYHNVLTLSGPCESMLLQLLSVQVAG